MFLPTLARDGTFNFPYYAGSDPLQIAACPSALAIIDRRATYLYQAQLQMRACFTNQTHALQMFMVTLTPEPLLQY